VLFLYGIAVSEPGHLLQMSIGGLLGIAAGVLAGMAVYFGLLRVAMRHLFGVTNGLIIFLAAGMASQCVASCWRPTGFPRGARRSGTAPGCSAKAASSARRCTH
jgi:high-affinity iron transporter